MLPDKAIKEFQEICKQEYGKDLSGDEAKDAGERLVRLFQLLYEADTKKIKIK